MLTCRLEQVTYVLQDGAVTLDALQVGQPFDLSRKSNILQFFFWMFFGASDSADWAELVEPVWISKAEMKQRSQVVTAG